ncbi:MAG: tRNA 2-thiouridine(34) synthase MnmA [Prevotellaceae bacterium]|nr:tRNA 2-thiouridine(34) synthase MnmA [Prevotellaceae bacterium]
MKTIAALVSGGVDSAVSIHLLKEQGYEPHLFYIKIGPEKNTEWNCTSEEDVEICNWLARKYGLKLDIIDLHKEYWENVVGYTMEKARLGLTPNPDVMCNKLIKFGCFEEKVGHEFDLTATGHYATTTVKDGKVWLSTSPDPVKDQTDFLCQINSLQVSKLVFPIGGLWKHEVRDIAAAANLLNARRKDSQGICFLGNIDFREYIKRNLGENPGDVREIETGKKIGTHNGLWFYTIGQRKGLGFGGGPWFVVKKNLKRNILFVSHGYDPERVYKQHIDMTDFHFITENPWLKPTDTDGKDSADKVCESHRVTFKIRHTPEYLTGTISRKPDGDWCLDADEKVHGVAPGQFCVVYDEDHHLCYGSGEII